MALDGSESHVLKVLVLGDPATGKTSIIKRYVHNFFSGHHKTTVGVDFHLKQLQINSSGTTVRLQLWDIAGQDRFGAIARVYYKDAFGAMLVYDVTRHSTFETVSKWKAEIDAKVLLPNSKPLPVVLIGNKCDLDRTPAIDEAKIEDIVKNCSFVDHFETSAKHNINIDKAAKFLVEKILEHQDIFQKKRTAAGAFQAGPGGKAKGGGCC